MRRTMLAGNWKMNKTIAELPSFFEGFIAKLDREEVLGDVDVLIAAPFTLLAETVRIAQPWGIRVAAQNLHFEEEGAFTGEVSCKMLREIGVDSALIGHSERRQYFGETDDSVAKKTVAAMTAGLTPIVCVGESLTEREAGQTTAVVTRQLQAVMEALDETRDLIIAYEPVWAIGTGKSATATEAQEVHHLIRSLVEEQFGKGVGEAVRILYGGSAKPSNIEELLKQRDIDGGLIGGASLKPDDFAQMVNIQEGLRIKP